MLMAFQETNDVTARLKPEGGWIVVPMVFAGPRPGQSIFEADLEGKMTFALKAKKITSFTLSTSAGTFIYYLKPHTKTTGVRFSLKVIGEDQPRKTDEKNETPADKKE